jgi:purine-nucleoside phosphorylase
MMKVPEQQAALKIRRAARGFIPDVGIILGSGLGAVAERVKAATTIPYSKICGLPSGRVAGHAGKLVLGNLAGKRVAVMAGRFHLYQGLSMREITEPVKLLAGLGVKTLLVTNAAGGISRTLKPGDLMLIEDHINMMGANPLVGESREGHPIFQDMTEAYSLRLRRILQGALRKEKIQLKRGVYLAASGPSYETPAEIRAFARLGADAVGMSTVPEVIVARSLGLEVCGVSCITNYAAGRTRKTLSHREVLEVTEQVEGKVTRLVERFVELL